MSSVITAGDTRLLPEQAATWFGERLLRLMPGAPEAAAEVVAWCLHQWMQGHSCLDLRGVVQAKPAGEDAPERLEARVPPGWANLVASLEAVGRAAEGSLEPLDRPLVLEGHQLFLARCRSQEIDVARDLARRATSCPRWCPEGRLDGRVLDFVERLSPPLHAGQVKAVKTACQRGLSVITGGPGTGKTTVAARIIEAVLEHGDPNVLLLAPTGKAAARLTEAMTQRADDASGVRPPSHAAAQVLRGLKGMTIHAATMQQRGEAVRRAGLIIVDETSMIDLELMLRLLSNARGDTSIVFLGDPHQLASVDAGTVLGDLVQGGALGEAVARLDHNWRFPADSPVGRLARAVNEGDADTVIACLRQPGEAVRWVPADTPARIVAEAIRQRQQYGADARILSGHRRGPDGSVRINAQVVRGVAGGATGHFEGRPIIVTVNDKATDLRNGDAGVMHEQGGQWVADFGARQVAAALLPAHETAYAMTIHKTQGSEYPSVVIALPAQPSPVLTRELLYTGITRTKRDVTIVGSEARIREAVCRPIGRSSGLGARLRAACAEAGPGAPRDA